MQYETNHRPAISICAAGLRGASDMMGVGRDLMPTNLYNTGYNPFLPGTDGEGDFRGQFGPKVFNTPNDATPQKENFGLWPHKRVNPYEKPIQPFDFGMDSTQNLSLIHI